jgi:manganese transport protein
MFLAKGARVGASGGRPALPAVPATGALVVPMNALVAGAGPVLTPSRLQHLRSRGRYRGSLALLGPAFVAAVAYVDPGNFATNFSAGARFGYALAWVIVVANAMAMLVQYLSAKAGVVTGQDLPELCRARFPRPVSWLLWAQAELVAMATDLAEFVGAAIGLNLLFGIAPLPAGLLTAVVAFGILGLEQRGYRRFELAIAGLLGVVLLGFVYDLVAVGATPASPAELLPHGFGPDALLLSAGIVGATVMPHVVYLHSALLKSRVPCADDGERREVLRFQRVDVLVALGSAGVINLAMLFVAAAVFGGGRGGEVVDSIEAAHAGLGRLAGGGAALAFAVALLASGLSSSSVGTYAGQVVMQGFIRRRVPLFLRRGLTMLPALAVLGLGLPTTPTMVASQIVLSFGIPFALVPLLVLTSQRSVMGSFVNRPATIAVTTIVAAAIVGLNGYVLYATFL